MSYKKAKSCKDHVLNSEAQFFSHSKAAFSYVFTSQYNGYVTLKDLENWQHSELVSEIFHTKHI